jgi:hypothetical protein
MSLLRPLAPADIKSEVRSVTHIMAAKHPASSAAGNAAAGSPPSSSTALNPDHDAQSGSKRVRGAGTVTQNACTECRKKRAKVRFHVLSPGHSLMCS